MRISLYKQFLLSTVLGPFGLFNVSAKAALALIALTAGALYISFENWPYILAASVVASMIIGNILVNRHNRLLDKNFQFSTFRGDVSCKVVRKEAADRDYDDALQKVRNKKLVNRLGIASLAMLCITATALLVIPKTRMAILSPSNTVAANIAEENNSNESDNITSQVQNNPVDVISSAQVVDPEILLGAIEYEESSYGLYRPKIDMSCERDIYEASFITDEVLGTDSTRLVVKINEIALPAQTWNVSDTYRVAISPEPKNLFDLLSTANSLSISYLPFGADKEKVAVFDMAKYADAMAKFKNRCEPVILLTQPELQPSTPEAQIATASPEPVSPTASPEAESQTTSSGPELQANSTDQVVPVISPEQELQVTSPELQVASPEPAPQVTSPELQAASPEPALQVTSPELQAASPEPELQTTSPEPELQAASPEPELQTVSPEPELQAASPESEPQTASPEPELQAASPEPELKTASPKSAAPQGLPGHF